MISKYISLCLLTAGLSLGLFPSQAVAAERAHVEGFTFVKSLDGIEEYRLDSNGLQVLVLSSHAAPVVSFQITYRVGSRNEVTGSTGGTHLLEHLMFKGSKNFNDDTKNGVATYLETVGAQFNATTSFDRTNYFATLGREALEGHVAIEADRMRNLRLREEDRQSEMTVVRNEYEQNENNPFSALNKQVMAAAFVAHPYHHPTIGWRSDIEKVSIDTLRAFYDTFYWPNNATAAIVGDIEPTQALALIKKYYGDIPRSPREIPTVYTQEPAQQGARRIVVKRTGAAGAIEILFRAPDARDADAPALKVLGLILAQGESSRLSRALKDTSLAADVDAEMSLQHDPGMFNLTIELIPGIEHDKAEKIALAELARVKRDGVAVAEITRVLGPYRAREAYKRDGTGSAVASLNEYIAMGDWTLYVTMLDKLQKVTPADVQRVANKYLNEDQSTTGWFVPEKKQ
jgi:zinc protease